MKDNTRKISIAAMFAALAFAVAALCNIVPITLVPVPFLHYDAKDVLITLCGFILGPVYALAVSLVTAIIEMAISSTGPIGALMNFLSSAIYACSAALVYKKVRNVYGAVTGLLVAVITTTGFMMLWNYLVTPMYMTTSREDVAKMLVPVFLPFNLIKSAINAGITLIIYKPIITALRSIKLIKGEGKAPTVSSTLLAFALGALMICAGLMAMFIIKGM